MIKEILIIISMFLAGYLFSKLRPIIFRRAKNVVKDKIVGLENDDIVTKKNKIITNSSIGKIYKKNDREIFQWKKFRKIFDLGSGVEWIKSIKEIMDLRKLTIYLLIAGCVFGYGYFRGRENTPVQILDYATEFRLNMNGEYLHKPPYSNDLYLKDSKTNKIIKPFYAKDFPLIAKKLKPIGFILEPIGIMGYGVGGINNSGIEGGAGISFLKYWRWKLDTFLTTKGIYLGTSYQLTSNSGLGLSAGKGYKGDSRVLLYYKWKF